MKTLAADRETEREEQKAEREEFKADFATEHRIEKDKLDAARRQAEDDHSKLQKLLVDSEATLTEVNNATLGIKRAVNGALVD